jgi:hypothetical protein
LEIRSGMHVLPGVTGLACRDDVAGRVVPSASKGDYMILGQLHRFLAAVRATVGVLFLDLFPLCSCEVRDGRTQDTGATATISDGVHGSELVGMVALHPDQPIAFHPGVDLWVPLMRSTDSLRDFLRVMCSPDAIVLTLAFLGQRGGSFLVASGPLLRICEHVAFTTFIACSLKARLTASVAAVLATFVDVEVFERLLDLAGGAGLRHTVSIP